MAPLVIHSSPFPNAPNPTPVQVPSPTTGPNSTHEDASLPDVTHQISPAVAILNKGSLDMESSSKLTMMTRSSSLNRVDELLGMQAFDGMVVGEQDDQALPDCF
ncbi:hypothetical protein HK102_013489 [Quaeritorhiza haematococci]|nr:hypothetical protein HK102_013489 [Quaeritorhiza haematococci]